jgi:hypothetical protein
MYESGRPMVARQAICTGATPPARQADRSRRNTWRVRARPRHRGAQGYVHRAAGSGSARRGPRGGRPAPRRYQPHSWRATTTGMRRARQFRQPILGVIFGDQSLSSALSNAEAA